MAKNKDEAAFRIPADWFGGVDRELGKLRKMEERIEILEAVVKEYTVVKQKPDSRCIRVDELERGERFRIWDKEDRSYYEFQVIDPNGNTGDDGNEDNSSVWAISWGSYKLRRFDPHTTVERTN